MTSFCSEPGCCPTLLKEVGNRRPISTTGEAPNRTLVGLICWPHAFASKLFNLRPSFINNKKCQTYGYAMDVVIIRGYFQFPPLSMYPWALDVLQVGLYETHGSFPSHLHPHIFLGVNRELSAEYTTLGILFGVCIGAFSLKGSETCRVNTFSDCQIRSRSLSLPVEGPPVSNGIK